MSITSFLDKIPPVYPITDKALAGKPNHFAIIKELVRGGAGLVQIRDKETPVKDLLADLKRCVAFCAGHSVLLIVNDRCDLALSAEADGVHLGQDDLPPEAARNLLGAAGIIGYSTHSLAQIRRASRLPIQYIGFGPVYLTATKPQPSPPVGIAGLSRACRQTTLPVIAIGGIGVKQIPEVLRAGARSAAVISAVLSGGDFARNMERLLRAAREIE